MRFLVSPVHVIIRVINECAKAVFLIFRGFAIFLVPSSCVSVSSSTGKISHILYIIFYS